MLMRVFALFFSIEKEYLDCSVLGLDLAMKRRKSFSGGWRRFVIVTAYKWLWPTVLMLVLLLLLLELRYLVQDTTTGKEGSDVDLKTNSTNSPIKENEKREPDFMAIPTTRGKPCINLLPEESIEKLQFPPSSGNTLLGIRYSRGVYSGSNITERFVGNQTMEQRNSSFQIHENMEVHCGFYEENTGFEIDKMDRDFLNKCEAVVTTCIFGGGDDLYQPIGMSNTSVAKVCYVAFWDEVTLMQIPEENLPKNDTRMVGLWRVVVVRNLPFSDQRRNGKIPKMLGHRLFPNARYSIWVDSKYRFRRDPMAVFQALLWSKQSSIAISQHGARNCVYKEGEAVVAKHKALPEEVDLQLNHYRAEGFPENAMFDGHKALAEASVIIREHSPITNLFMCVWFNEVVRYTARDQLSFPYVLRRFDGILQVNMFPVCTRKSLVLAFKHKQKAKLLDDLS